MPPSRNQPSYFTLRNARLFASFITAARWNSRRAPFRIRQAFSCLAAAGFVTSFPSVSLGQQFVDVSTQVGLIATPKKSWGNPIWGDINNDGFLDLIVPCHGLQASGGPFVYLNNGGTTFTDIRATCGIGPNNPDSLDWHGFSFGDFDGDGKLDLYIAEGAVGGTQSKSDEFFRGRGDGTFEYDARQAGIEISVNRGRCSVFFDYDNDGKLDLFVKNFDGMNRLYKNNGDRTFTIVPDGGGLMDATSGLDYGTIVSIADYNNDGFMDMAITGDGNAQALYKNMGNGTFVDAAAFGETRPHEKGLAWGDYNNDGLIDLCIVRGGALEDIGVTLYRNNGDGTFTDVTTAAHVADTGNDQAPVWGDYDNDGFLDLFVTKAGRREFGRGNANLLYHNNGDGTFTNRAAQEGVELQDNYSLHRGAAWADYNNDGFLDLLVKDGIGSVRKNGEAAKGLHRLFKNNGNSNHFIKVTLKGLQSNRNGIGARVTVMYTGGMSYRQNNGGGGGEWASQGSEPLHFGIGTATEATLEVKWPSGIVDTLSSVAANSTVTVVEGSAP